MCRITFSCVLCVLLCSSCFAQEVPKYEVYGGYSYLRGKGAAIASRVDENTDMHGWNVSAVRNFNDWFGLVADFSGQYGNRQSRFPTADGEFRSRTDKNMHLFLFGPRVSLSKRGRVTAFAHSLFGVARAHTETEERFASFPPNRDSNTDVGFAAAFGVGLDIRQSQKIALRAVQADYVLTKIDSNNFARENRENLRLSAGISFRFGE